MILGDIRTMSNESKSRVTFFVVGLVIIVFWLLCLPVLRFVFMPYDAARLAPVAHRIADADRIVGTYARSSVSVTVRGDDAKRIIRAVSSGSPARPSFGMDWACIYDVKATFFKGTNVLDDIEICSSLFLLHHSKPPFRDDTGLLHDIVYAPVSKAAQEAEMKKIETQ